MTNILIVDDQDDMRAGIRSMLLLDPTFVVVGDLSDGLQVPAFLRDNAVDLVLMDIRMPGIDGVEATRRIRAEHAASRLRVIVLTTFDQDEIVLAALRAGVCRLANVRDVHQNDRQTLIHVVSQSRSGQVPT
jgi:DNA-binding NarL/FixJ family response regulator